jgi:hypothetical protein
MMQEKAAVHGKDQGIHVSGHGCQEDQKLMIGLTVLDSSYPSTVSTECWSSTPKRLKALASRLRICGDHR